MNKQLIIILFSVLLLSISSLGAVPPNPANLASPSSGATGMWPLSVMWTDGGGGTTGYDLYLGTTNPPAFFRTQGYSAFNSYVDYDYNSPFGETYYWRVVPFNEDGHTPIDDCPVWNLTLTDGNVSLTSPSEAATNVALSNIEFIFNRGFWTMGGANYPSQKISIGTSSGAADLVNLQPPTSEDHIGGHYIYTGTLDYSTTYYWSVTTTYNLGVNAGYSIQSLEGSFTTRADPTITSFPYIVDFNDDWYNPVDWKFYWGALSNPSVLVEQPYSGNWYIQEWLNDWSTNNLSMCYNIYGNNNSGWFISPPLDIPGDDYQVSFDVAYMKYYETTTAMTNGGDDKFVVLVGDGNTWTPANAIRQWDNSGSPYVLNDIALTGEKVIVPIGSAGVKKIAFYAGSVTANADNDLEIDNIEVRQSTVPAVISVTPNTWNFGSTFTYMNNNKRFKIMNEGLTPLYISSINVSGTYYALVGEFTPITLGLGEATTFTVNYNPTLAGSHNGTVTINDNRAQTTIQLSGECNNAGIYSFPYLNDFEGTIDGWSILDINHDGFMWYLSDEGMNGLSARIPGNWDYPTIPSNDWFISPPLYLTAGTTYEFKYSYGTGNASGFSESMRAKIGTSPTPEGMTVLLADYPTITNMYTTAMGMGTFTPSTAGPYFLGFQGYSNPDGAQVDIDDVRITTPGYDVVTLNGTIWWAGNLFDLPILYNPLTGLPQSTRLEFPPVAGNPTVNITAEWNPTDVSLPNPGLVFTISATPPNLAGTTITVIHNLGFIPSQIAFRVLPAGFTVQNNPDDGSWTTTQLTVTVPAGKAAGDFQVVLPQAEDQTLPIELSSFTAVLNAENNVSLSWTTQTETNCLGYYIYRYQEDNVSQAIAISPLIQGTNTSQTSHYIFVDNEIPENGLYYYWLMSVDMSGSSCYHGPISVNVLNQDNPENPPEIIRVTGLNSVFPNPFNPTTTISYSLANASDVAIRIINRRGQIIRTIRYDNMNPGDYNTVWDGTDEHNRECASGLYFIQLEAGWKRFTRKAILMK